MKRRKGGRVIERQLRGIRRCPIHVGAKPLRLPISIQLPEIFVEAAVLLHHENDVIDRGYVCSRGRGRWRGRSVVIAAVRIAGAVRSKAATGDKRERQR